MTDDTETTLRLLGTTDAQVWPRSSSGCTPARTLRRTSA